MAENQPPDEAPTPPSGLPALPAGQPPTPLPPGLNADEYRRFQEFQRFQDYQRFVASQGGGPSAEVSAQLSDMRQQLARIERVTNPPTWQKVLRNKWLHRLVWLVVLVVLATWGVPQLIHHYFGNSNEDKGPAALPLPVGQSGILPTGPHQAVADVYMFVAENQPTPACIIFSASAKTSFVRSVGTKDCPSAVRSLYGQLTDKDSYAAPDLTYLPSPQGPSMVISSCEFTVAGGPRLGTFTLTKQQEGWEITGYAAPALCPAPSSSGSTPPTS